MDDTEDSVSEDVVRLRDFFVVPAAQLEYSGATIRLHPKAMAALGYDSNIYASSTDRIADEYGYLLAGMECRWWNGESHRGYIDGEVEGTRYAHRHERDTIGLRLRAHYDIEQSEAVAYRLSAAHQRIDDPLLETGRPVQRGITDAAAQGTWAAAVTAATLRLDYQNADYLENDAAFQAHERDSNTVGTTFIARRRTGTISEFQLRIRGARQVYADDGMFQDNTRVEGGLGWTTTLLTRTTLHLEAGATYLAFADDFNHDPAYADKRAFGPTFNISANWDPEPISYVRISAYREIVPTVYSNSASVLAFEAYSRYRLLINSAVIAAARAYRYDASGAAAGNPKESRRLIAGAIGAEYYLREGVVSRIIVTEEVNHARVGDDYERTVLTLELGMAY